jgi:Protein of unknown function (DUF2971)
MPDSPQLLGLEQPLKYLTDKDKESVGRFFFEYAIAKHLLSNPKDGLLGKAPLYHYTTGETLVRILESQELWCTQISCLNDTTEFTYAVEELQKRVRARIAEEHDSTLNPLLAGLDQYLSAPNAETASLFVTCFSERGDDLSQWRAYARGEGGYAIQFDPGRLIMSSISGDSAEQMQIEQMLMRVEYDPKQHDAFLTDILKQGEKFFSTLEGASKATPEEWVAEFVRYWLWNLQFLAPCLKHPKFENEREWRFVYSLRTDDAKRMQFRQRQSMMTRHVPLRLKKPLPITGVIVGPCRHPQLSRVAVGDLLKKFGYDPDIVKVSVTQVPYRAV